MQFCECNRNHLNPKHYGPGGILICSICNRYVLCDFCKGVELDNPFMSVARYPIAESFACWHHAWRSIAMPMRIGSLH